MYHKSQTFLGWFCCIQLCTRWYTPTLSSTSSPSPSRVYLWTLGFAISDSVGQSCLFSGPLTTGCTLEKYHWVCSWYDVSMSPYKLLRRIENRNDGCLLTDMPSWYMFPSGSMSLNWFKISRDLFVIWTSKLFLMPFSLSSYTSCQPWNES